MLYLSQPSNLYAGFERNHVGRPSTGPGTSVTPGTTSKGSWTQAIASASTDVFGIFIYIYSNGTAASSRNTVLDIGIGPSGSEIVIVPDLICGNASTIQTGFGVGYFFPLFIPAGSRVSVRGQSTVTNSFFVLLNFPLLPTSPESQKTAQYIETYGITGRTGENLTPGSTTISDWVLVGTTTKPVWHWELGIQVQAADATHNAATYFLDVAVGDSSNKTIVINSWFFVTTTAEQHMKPPIVTMNGKKTPAGTNVYLRGWSSAAADTCNVAVYAAGG